MDNGNLQIKTIRFMAKPYLSIIVPVYNEEESIVNLHRELLDILTKIDKEYEIIFVDDGSTDHTLDKLKELRQLKIISFTQNFGKSYALQAGFEQANGEIIITLDGDLQDDPQDIPGFLKKMEQGYDLVVGWRKERSDSISKKIPSLFYNFLNRYFSGLRIHDMNCGFKSYRARMMRYIPFFYGNMYRFIPLLAGSRGFRITEIIVNHRQRKFGKSKYGASRLLSGFLDFLTVLFLKGFVDKPMHIFGLIGFILSSIGSAVLVYLVWLRLAMGMLIGHRPILLLGVLLVVVGFQFFSLGFLSELLIYINPSGRRRYSIKERLIRD